MKQAADLLLLFGGIAMLAASLLRVWTLDPVLGAYVWTYLVTVLVRRLLA